MNLDSFLQTAWSDHSDRPQEVADRLAASFHLVLAPGNVAPYARLLTHVYGEHLGQWQHGAALLESLRGLPAFDGGAAASGPITTGIAALRYAGGDVAALDLLSLEDRVSALATASAAFAGREDHARAIAAFGDALRCAQPGLPAGSPAVRALAVGGNNLAAALEAKPRRDAVETRAMVSAAEAGLKYWKHAGTWIEEERAEYQLTRSLLQAGEAAAAVQSAGRCIELCERNDAPPFEQFFGHAVLALAHRAAGDSDSFDACRQRAMSHWAQVPEEERKWCERERKELGA